MAESNAANRKRLFDGHKRRIIERYTPSKMANHLDDDLTGFEPTSLSRLDTGQSVANRKLQLRPEEPTNRRLISDASQHYCKQPSLVKNNMLRRMIMLFFVMQNFTQGRAFPAGGPFLRARRSNADTSPSEIQRGRAGGNSSWIPAMRCSTKRCRQLSP